MGRRVNGEMKKFEDRMEFNSGRVRKIRRKQKTREGDKEIQREGEGIRRIKG